MKGRKIRNIATVAAALGAGLLLTDWTAARGPAMGTAAWRGRPPLVQSTQGTATQNAKRIQKRDGACRPEASGQQARRHGAGWRPSHQSGNARQPIRRP